MKDLETSVINNLVNLKWTEFEAKAFLALYKGYRMSATQIAKEANITRPSVYEVLRSLIKRGICYEIKCPTRLEYELTDRKEIEDKIIIANEENYKTNISLIKGIFENLQPLYKTNPEPSSVLQVEIIKGYNRH